MSAFFYNPRGRGGNTVPFRKRKSRFTFDEVQLLLNEVRNNRHIVIGKFNRGVSADVKKRTWAEITARINEISECPREIIEVIKKWSDLKCDTKRKVAAMRAGGTGGPLRLSRDLSPVENMVHQILQLPPPDGAAGYPGGWAGLGHRRAEENGDDDDDDDDVVLGMPVTGAVPEGGSVNGRLDIPGVLPVPPLHPHPLGMPGSVPVPPLSLNRKGELIMPPSMYRLSAREPAFSLPVSGDPSLPSYEMHYEIPHSEDQVVDLEDSDGDRREGPRPPPFLPPPSTAEEERLLSGLRRVASSSSAPPSSSSSSSAAFPAAGPSASASAPPPPSSRVPDSPPQPPVVPPTARDRMLQNAAASVQEQHAANLLLETVSRSLVLLSESVQQLVETQQEFVRDSLRLQQETVHILRDFSSGALALMRDKLNGRPSP
ncbi:myb-related transcription factor, partner of profilin [Megalops cyprinoides]|uniref:myb-related transcription factor, partner of profilin n=1 Tax=Megalops cyprinoides TaxID=118141 RepID=UPI001864D594|nr:myb-related transcription factor, partner of profilin [Megalops cyprinoides]